MMKRAFGDQENPAPRKEQRNASSSRPAKSRLQNVGLSPSLSGSGRGQSPWKTGRLSKPATLCAQDFSREKNFLFDFSSKKKTLCSILFLRKNTQDRPHAALPHPRNVTHKAAAVGLWRRIEPFQRRGLASKLRRSGRRTSPGSAERGVRRDSQGAPPVRRRAWAFVMAGRGDSLTIPQWTTRRPPEEGPPSCSD
jgi:hypothetical protein